MRGSDRRHHLLQLIQCRLGIRYALKAVPSPVENVHAPVQVHQGHQQGLQFRLLTGENGLQVGQGFALQCIEHGIRHLGVYTRVPEHGLVNADVANIKGDRAVLLDRVSSLQQGQHQVDHFQIGSDVGTAVELSSQLNGGASRQHRLGRAVQG